ncbi:hypothetical protein [Gallaecimonas xiamenensis]|uniref:hypothetical protein n=1 Tax=Gallaecimonas xiamenensis TaxID=1207039 RepID=UPI0012EAE07A|nr:hypothetical protein [Gallaecimonas xiamenensis]
MYRFPSDLDLSANIGEATTQFRIGQYDFQFSIGNASFQIATPVTLIKNGSVIGSWKNDQWPSPEFKNIFNVNLKNVEIRSDKLLVLTFENNIEMHLVDNSDQFESMTIWVDKELWVI